MDELSAPTMARIHLPLAASPAWAVFSDFDESWLAHRQTEEQAADLRALEATAAGLATSGRVLFAWVSGCTLDLILRRCEHLDVRAFPPYIVASHGGELVRWEGGNWIQESEWLSAFDAVRFGREAARVVADFNRHVELLRPQVQASPCIRSYYLSLSRGDRIPALRALAAAAGLEVVVSPSNPKAGEPAETYDVDFTPGGVSKHHAAQYLMRKHGVQASRSVAFGDNVGDVDMLRGVGRGFLLGNAHPAAKALHPEQLPWPYARGIRECLNNVIGDAPGGAEVYG